MPKAYSYLRFSTPEQRKGDSQRRQATMATEYAERHGLDLDDKLTFQDLGVSAWRGRNSLDGALAGFMEAVRNRLIPADSYLLVESLDRVSRQHVGDAFDLLKSIVKLGVTVVTLTDNGKAYTREQLRTEPMAIMQAVFHFARANEESAMKSQRLRAKWQQKGEGHRTAMTAVAPGWLRLNRDKQFEVIPDRAELVRRMFAMAASGMGKSGIARKLNAEGIPTWKATGKGWHGAVVAQILSNPAVIGRYQPHTKQHDDNHKLVRRPAGPPIEGYFPPIVDADQFYRVSISRGISGKGKDAAPVNVLAGLARCAACGGPLHYVGGARPPLKSYAYLACDNQRRRRTCTAKAVRYDITIEALLLAMEDGEIRLGHILQGGASDRRKSYSGTWRPRRAGSPRPRAA